MSLENLCDENLGHRGQLFKVVVQNKVPLWTLAFQRVSELTMI